MALTDDQMKKNLTLLHFLMDLEGSYVRITLNSCTLDGTISEVVYSKGTTITSSEGQISGLVPMGIVLEGFRDIHRLEEIIEISLVKND